MTEIFVSWPYIILEGSVNKIVVKILYNALGTYIFL